ncbi:neutral zinc metallopeptidase [Amycolatopsis sp. EV170708-02-1]|uniref:neutral zinc metallopeptidase n=1 Tax=Amycolatopsis sp. EV170708-02-1 TaxID=2919322 RepID=UPI001F0C2E96|nr:neutral zinc metallopeptidase [Amycolatopsis sp. EV170708-02-1]UMP06934.1 neutral zinc metallopeptidase [Amycolatopsis sp. EV170708-02-1]
MKPRQVWATMVTLFASALFLFGCVTSVGGNAQPVDPNKVAGLDITNGPSGVKPGAPDAGLPVDGGDGGEIDRLAANAVADVQRYWREQSPAAFNRKFEPIATLVSYDSTGSGRTICGASTAGLVNAFYCSLNDVVAWDRGELLPMFKESIGETAVLAVLAHEVGHALQFRLGLARETPSIVKEQQADCYTGAYFRWVAEGRSPAFQVSTGQGLNEVLTTLFQIRDSAGVTFSDDGAHGNAFDRVSAFQFGFADGPARCQRIDVAEIASRSTQGIGSTEGAEAEEQNLRLDDRQAMKDLTDSLLRAFKLAAAPPRLTAGVDCGATTVDSLASYCSESNQITLDLDGLVRIGTPPQRGGEGGIGDFAAFAEVASRYTLAVQQEGGFRLDGPAAARRTACLTGYWASTIVAGKGSTLSLSPGDLDEAIAEMLARDSLIAADVRGEALAAGFARVEAFRVGFASGRQETCGNTYR